MVAPHYGYDLAQTFYSKGTLKIRIRILDQQTAPKEHNFHETRAICGFWRRLFALTIDSIFIGIIGLIIGSVGYNFFSQLGGYGRLIGFAIALTYFGFANSSIFGGQTLGKKIFKIQVIGANGETISLPKSLLRYTMLSLPFFFNGAPIAPDIMHHPVVMMSLALIVFFMGGSIIYLYIFNRRTRQSVHDLVVGTYVINFDEPLAAESVWKGHMVTIGIFLVLIIVGTTVIIPKLAQKKLFAELLIAQQQIQASGMVHYSTLSSGSSWTYNSNSDNKNEHTYLAVNAVMKYRPENFEKSIAEIATLVINSFPSLYEKDSLMINAIYGYDIGIARAWKNQNQQASPAEWEKMLTSDNL